MQVLCIVIMLILKYSFKIFNYKIFVIEGLSCPVVIDNNPDNVHTNNYTIL